MNASRFQVGMLLAVMQLFTATKAHSAEPPVDGLYLNARGASTAEAFSQDGQVVLLGTRQYPSVLEKQLRSERNDNESYRLTLTIPYQSLEPRPDFLVVAGTAYHGRSSTNGTISLLDFHIDSEDRAKEVAQYIDVPVTYFHHPGHRLRVSIEPTEESWLPGADVTATLRIVNVGSEPVAFLRGGRDYVAAGIKGRDNQFNFSAYLAGNPVPDIGSNTFIGGFAQKTILQPDANVRVLVHLNKWFDFKDAGIYAIHCSFYVAFTELDAGPFDAYWIGKNELPHGAIWTDYVGADFVVEIKK